MDDSFGYWLAGFIDGEGCFSITPERGRFLCRFGLRVRDDERETLEAIVSTTGIGYLSRCRGYATTKPQVIWEVKRKDDCLKLVDLLERYPLRAKKRHDFEIWKEAVRFWSTSMKRGERDWSVMGELQDELKSARRYCVV